METLATGLIGTVLVGGRVVSLLSMVGTDFIIKSLTLTTSGICSTIGNLVNRNEPYMETVVEQLVQLDLEHIATVIEELVKEQEGKEAQTSVKKALVGVHVILDKIHNELTTIDNALDYHKTKYFNSWRSFDCSCNIKTIKNHSRILEYRYKILINLLKIYG